MITEMRSGFIRLVLLGRLVPQRERRPQSAAAGVWEIGGGQPNPRRAGPLALRGRLGELLKARVGRLSNSLHSPRQSFDHAPGADQSRQRVGDALWQADRVP